MTPSNVIPFTATSPAYRTGCSAVETGASHGPPAGAHPIPADLEQLAATHADDLRRGSALDALLDVFEAAKDTRNNRPHVPEGVIAAAAVELLAPVLVELGEIIGRLARRGALAEAEGLDRELSGMSQDDQLALWRDLTPAQRSAVIWVQAAAMTPGGAA